MRHAQHSAMPHPVFRQVSGHWQLKSHVHPVQFTHVPLQLAAHVFSPQVPPHVPLHDA